MTNENQNLGASLEGGEGMLQFGHAASAGEGVASDGRGLAGFLQRGQQLAAFLLHSFQVLVLFFERPDVMRELFKQILPRRYRCRDKIRVNYSFSLLIF